MSNEQNQMIETAQPIGLTAWGFGYNLDTPFK